MAGAEADDDGTRGSLSIDASIDADEAARLQRIITELVSLFCVCMCAFDYYYHIMIILVIVIIAICVAIFDS